VRQHEISLIKILYKDKWVLIPSSKFLLPGIRDVLVNSPKLLRSSQIFAIAHFTVCFNTMYTGSRTLPADPPVPPHILLCGASLTQWHLMTFYGCHLGQSKTRELRRRQAKLCGSQNHLPEAIEATM